MDLQSSLCFIFFTFTAIFSLFSLSLFIIRFNPCCSCEICTAFITRAWTSEFVNLSDWYTHLLRNSATGTIHVHVLNNIITANPDNVEYMIKTNFDNFPKGKAFSDILGDLLGRGIFNVDGNHWRFQRKLASLELGSLAIRSHALKIVSDEIESRLIPLFSTVAEKGENDENDAVLDLQDVFRRFSFDSICKFSFGSDPGSLTPSLPVSELESAFDLSSKRCAERGMTPSPLVWKFKRLFNIGSEKELKSSVNVVKKMAGKIIKERREMDPKSSKCSDPGQTNDLLSRFMGSISDDDYLRDIVISFLLAGRDTVASALTSFFPYYFPKTRSMRLYPPVQFDSKFTKQDDVFPDGTFVKRGSRVTYHPYAMGRMERIWGPDSLEFKPERWIRDGEFRQESVFKYPVYQGGVRVCLGREMSLVEMKSVALCLVRRFDVKVVNPNRWLRFLPGLTATVSGGLPAVVRLRK
ncbi:hypothetical protein SSX86_009097 [Deinandra increscens subsp. villosa]|uniref:Cytochrome P450 n=1 Tax=Deinandra increscens subsp. villosa TaxID=3103831 RepID=A0AAP0DHB4_9ASTR